MTKFIKTNKIFIFFFFAVTLIAVFFPPSADDLGWATSQGAALLEKGFKNYNGRYLGNLLAVSLTRIGLFLAPIKAFVFTAILFYIKKLSPKASDFALIICAVLMLIPLPLFIQGFVWTAGFTNYTVSALLLLIAADLILNGKCNAVNAILLFIIGICCQLFMETYTIFALVSGIAAIIFSLKKKNGTVKSISFFAGAIIGTVIMFSNGVYRKIAAGDDVYQKMAPGSESGLLSKALFAIKSLVSTVSQEAVIACIPAIIITLILAIMLIKKQAKFKTAFWSLFGAMLASVVAFPVVFLIIKDLEKASFCLGAFLLFYFAACAVAVIGMESKESKVRIGILFVMLLVMCAPLSVVFPVGPRCFAGANVLLMLIICEMAKDISLSLSPKALRVVSGLLAVVVAIDVACYSTVFFSNKNKIETIRTQAEQGNRQIVIEHTKLYFFVYSIDTENKAPKYMQRFCEYYGLPEDIEIIYK